jgi:hypothetical protein
LYYRACNPEDDIVNAETCQDSDEFKLVSRNCVVIYCTVTINNAMEHSSAQLNTKICPVTIFISYDFIDNACKLIEYTHSHEH